jgi:hypothetical protein
LQPAKGPISPQQIQIIQELAGSLAYGSISLIFQDGKLIQIEKNEKFRTDRTTENER